MTDIPEYEFGDVLTYRTPKGSRRTLVVFVRRSRIKGKPKALVASKDRATLQKVDYDRLKRAKVCTSETARLRVEEIDDPVLSVALTLRIRNRVRKEQLASFFDKSEVRPVLGGVIRALEVLGVAVSVDDELLQEDPRG